MDIKNLSEATGLKMRQIRYVLDHDLIPLELLDEGYESTKHIRTFALHQGVHIASAAALLSAGVRSETIRRLFADLSRIEDERPTKISLPILDWAALKTYREAKAQVADVQYVRWILNGKPGPWYDTDQTPFKKLSELTPLVTVEVNIGVLAQSIDAYKKKWLDS